jgi:hypothetical protein
VFKPAKVKTTLWRLTFCFFCYRHFNPSTSWRTRSNLQLSRARGHLDQHRPGGACNVHHTLYHTLDTIHCTPYTVHHTLDTVHWTPYTRTPYTVHHTLYTIHCTPYTVHHTLDNIHSYTHTLIRHTLIHYTP